MSAAVSNETIASATSLSLASLIRLRGQIGKIRRRRGARVVTRTSGGAATRALGRGLDFAEVREYYAGDDVRLIDWNVTARSGKPHTKIFNEERERPFILLIDMRASMLFATQVAYKSVQAARLGERLGWAAADARDAVGGIVVTDRSIVEVDPRSGSRGVTALLHAMVRQHQVAASEQLADRAAEGNPLVDVFRRLQRRNFRGASICLLSDWQDASTQSLRSATKLLRQNHCVAVRLWDPLERELPPPARYSITDRLAKVTIDSSSDQARKAYQAAFVNSTAALEKLFTSAGGRLLTLGVTEPLAPVASRILRALPGSAA